MKTIGSGCTSRLFPLLGIIALAATALLLAMPDKDTSSQSTTDTSGFSRASSDEIIACASACGLQI